jgi:hypothetical protein
VPPFEAAERLTVLDPKRKSRPVQSGHYIAIPAIAAHGGRAYRPFLTLKGQRRSVF